MFKRTVTVFGVIVALSASSAVAQTSEDFRSIQNHGVVGVMGGSLTGTYSQMVYDMAQAFDDKDLRIIPMIGKGSLNAAGDLLYLRGVDAAIVQSDVLDFLKTFKVYNGGEKNLAYITKMFNEEVHLVANRNINSIYDLKDKKVSFGPSKSGGFMTASVIFDRLGITVRAQDMSHVDGLEALRNGEIDAMVRVSGAPVKFLTDIDWEDQLHIVPIPPIEGASYVQSTVTAEQYPGLIPLGEKVDTAAVLAILVAYNWGSDHPRRARVQALVDRLTTRLPELLSDKYHPKWRQVDLDAEVPGWPRWTSPGS